MLLFRQARTALSWVRNQLEEMADPTECRLPSEATQMAITSSFVMSSDILSIMQLQ